MILAYGVGIVAVVALFAALGFTPLAAFLAVATAFMTTFIVAAVDESVRN